MQDGTKLKDRFGLPVTTSSPAAAEHCFEGIDLLLSQNFGPEARFQQAIDTDEGFALAHGCLAWVSMLRGKVAEAKESAARAQALTAGISARERQQIEAISLWVNGQGPQALALIQEHLKEYPRDTLLLRQAQRLYIQGCSGAGVPNFPEELFALCTSLEKHCDDDWAFLGSYAFAHHETARLEGAFKLANRYLDMKPTNAVAAHSVTHVYFERGDASQGGDFLGTWLEGFDKRAAYHVHLSWHQALFELGMGHYQTALNLYETDVRPSVIEKSAASLSDSASFLWRLQLYSQAAPPFPWEEVRDQAAPAAKGPGPAFRDGHAALAFAGTEDHEAMGQLRDRLKVLAGQGDPLAQEMTLPLVSGIAAFAEGSYDEAVRLLEPVCQQLERIGGSHAQREVFEDTLLEAYLRAEQFDKGEDMLRTRLSRRASVRDTFWLGRAQSGNHQPDQARSTFQQAAKSWEEYGAASPEYDNLNRFASQSV